MPEVPIVVLAVVPVRPADPALCPDDMPAVVPLVRLAAMPAAAP